MENKGYIFKMVIFLILAALAMLSPLNLLCLFPALLLGVHLCAHKKHLWLLAALPIGAVLAVLGFADGVILFCLTTAAVCAAAWFSLSRGFDTLKIALWCGAAFCLSALIAAFAAVAINGYIPLLPDAMQIVYDEIYKIVLLAVDYATKMPSRAQYLIDLTQLELVAYQLTLSVPGFFAAACGGVGVISAFICIGARPGLRPRFLQFLPIRFTAIAFLVCQLAVMTLFGGSLTWLCVAADIFSMALMALFIVRCIASLYLRFKTGTLGILIPMILIFSAFSVGLAVGMSNLGAFLTVIESVKKTDMEE